MCGGKGGCARVCVCACVCVFERVSVTVCAVFSLEGPVFETLQCNSNGFITYLTYTVDVCVSLLMHAYVSVCD